MGFDFKDSGKDCLLIAREITISYCIIWVSYPPRIIWMTLNVLSQRVKNNINSNLAFYLLYFEIIIDSRAIESHYMERSCTLHSVSPTGSLLQKHGIMSQTGYGH